MCNKWGFKGCLAALPGNRPKSAFFALFLPFSPFSGGCEEHLGNPENVGKRPFPQISSDFLKPPSLKPPFAALQQLIPPKHFLEMPAVALLESFACGDLPYSPLLESTDSPNSAVKQRGREGEQGASRYCTKILLKTVSEYCSARVSRVGLSIK